MKMLAHNEEVSSLLWALSRTSGFQNILIFLLRQYNSVLWAKEKQCLLYKVALRKLLIFSNYVLIIKVEKPH